jgi:CRISPR-associated protein Cmr2
MNNSFRPDADYWDRKLSCYLHDPPDKALQIPGHEERANALLAALGDLPSLDKSLYQRADMVASGMDRGQFPGYDRDPARNGAVDFIEEPRLTHPTGENKALVLDLAVTADPAVIHQQMLAIFKTDLDGDESYKGLCSRFMGNPAALASARFHYVHHALRERLAMENVGGLGGLWYRLPADTRMPDHSVWHHCGLVSALATCFAESDTRKASIMVFSLAPVQDFISRARKLKDFWAGSLILSWLAFEGIREIIYGYGSDHIIYPSLINQPMVNRLLVEECGFSAVNLPDGWVRATGVASLPNKFVFLAPAGREQEIADAVTQGIQKAWRNLGQKTLEQIEKVVGETDRDLNAIFKRQIEHFWSFQWSACPLPDEGNREAIVKLLPKSVWANPLRLIDDSKGLPHPAKGEGTLYQAAHALAQVYLAAGKLRKEDSRPAEEGIKCQLHGDLEALRFEHAKAKGNKNPRPENDPFWGQFRREWQRFGPSDFKETERISAVAIVKRLAGHVTGKMDHHPLKPFFASRRRFPSTTEMALTDWFVALEEAMPDAKGEIGDNWKAKLAQYVHEAEAEGEENPEVFEIEPVTPDQRSICRRIILAAEKKNMGILDQDRYYAILLMDGDKMGSLVNGETLASSWRSVLHPSLTERLANPDFAKNFHIFWKKWLDEPRLLSPSVHAALSEALGDFALATVPAIIERHRGVLIYAGGDDVCAVMPVSTALVAAREIAVSWGHGFVMLNGKGAATPVSGSWRPGTGRLAIHLGQGKDISISAGIYIVHHKQPLIGAIRRAHQVLDMAKEKGDRNAVAVELAKRSGGKRCFVSKWNEAPLDILRLTDPFGKLPLLDHFTAVAQGFGKRVKPLSGSLVYRLEDFRPGLQTLLEGSPSQLTKLIATQVKRATGEKDEKKLTALAATVTALLARRPKGGEPTIETEPLAMARFLGPAMRRQGGETNGE